MSKIDRHRDFTPSPHEQRIVMRVLGCGVEELVTRFGTENAIKRVETELRRAKRARSRKLYAFWSDVLVRTRDAEARAAEKQSPHERRGA